MSEQLKDFEICLKALIKLFAQKKEFEERDK
jgi:hypothetical protein